MKLQEFSKQTVDFTVKTTVKVAKSDFVQNIVRDLQSVRVLWNWIVGGLFVWCCWYGMTHIPAVAGTIVVTVGGVFSAVLTNYVWSSHLERKNGNGNGNGTTPPVQISGNPNGNNGNGAKDDDTKSNV